MPKDFLDWSDLILKKSLSEDEELCKAKPKGAAVAGFQTQAMKDKKKASRQKTTATDKEFDRKAGEERAAREKNPETFRVDPWSRKGVPQEQMQNVKVPESASSGELTPPPAMPKKPKI